MIRCGYGGNNYSIKEIAKETGDGTVYPLNITVNSSGNLLFSDQYHTHTVRIISIKPI